MELFLLFIAGFAVGGVVFWLVSEKRANQQFAATLEQNNQKLNTEHELRIRAEAELQAFKQAGSELEKRVAGSFENVADRAVRNNHELLVTLAKGAFEQYMTKAEAGFAKHAGELGNLLNPLKEKIETNDLLVKNIQTAAGETFGSLKEKLDSLTEAQKSLEKETSALVTALKAPKIRGRWGELGLKRVVEFSGLNAYTDFTEQAYALSDSNAYKPDMVVHLPGNRQIIVDSKVPLNSYLDALETPDENLRNALLERHATAVLNHAKQLGSKAYWSAFEKSVDFVILYIEVEPAFGAALVGNKQLIEFALQHRIVFATPTTLITMLQTVAYTWKQHNAAENAVQIWKQAKELYERLAVFSEHYSKIGATISNLAKTYNQSVGSWESRIMPGIRKLTELDADSQTKELLTPPVVEVEPRQFTDLNPM